jgi:phage repressor protein C with HTH and peptisase S24 domain
MSAIGHAVRRLREERGWTQAELGEKVGLDGTNIARREKGTTKVKPAERFKFAEAFGMPVIEFDEAWRLFYATRTQGGRGIPLINKAPAGEAVDYEEFGIDSGQGYEYLDYGDIRDDQAFALEIVGDSMKPRLYEGDRVIFTHCDPYNGDSKLADGKIVFVRFHEHNTPSGCGGCMVARFYHMPDGRILLRKDNPDWGPLMVDREAIVQMAVAIERREKL